MPTPRSSIISEEQGSVITCIARRVVDHPAVSSRMSIRPKQSSDDKENQVPEDVKTLIFYQVFHGHGVLKALKSSRMRRPRTAAAILKSKSNGVLSQKHFLMMRQGRAHDDDNDDEDDDGIGGVNDDGDDDDDDDDGDHECLTCIAELNQDQFDKKLAEMYEKAVDEQKEDENMHPLARELKRSSLNFSEILNTKISAKGSTLRDQKKHLDDQKSLISKLREGLVPWLVCYEHV